MKFLWTTIHVKDMEESLKFYEEVVKLKKEKSYNSGPGMEISFLSDGETKLELIWIKDFKDFEPGNSISIGFETDSIDEKLDLIKKRGLQIVTEPISPNPHMKFFIALDPNGVRVQFVQNF